MSTISRMNNEHRRNAIIEKLRSIEGCQAELLWDVELSLIDATQEDPSEHQTEEIGGINMSEG